MKTPYDPKLRLAAKEMEEILKKYDIMGALVLASKTHAEFLFHFDSTWSVARLQKLADGNTGIRFRSKKEDFPSKEAQHEATEATVHGLTTMLQFGGMVQSQMRQVVDQLRRHMKIMFEVWGKPFTGDYDKK